MLFTFTQSLVLSPDFWCGKKVDCRMFFFFSKKMMIQGHRECSCLWFLIVWPLAEAIVISFSWQMVLGYLGLNRWISWQSNPLDHLGCISETFTKPLQLMGSFTCLSTGAGFLSVKSTASHLAIARFSHTSLTNQYRISQMWRQGHQGRSKQWRRSLRLKLKKELWKSSFVSKKRQLPVSCASLFTERERGRTFLA